MTDTTRTCAGCDTPIIPGPRERNRKKWCTEACRIKAYRNRNPDYVARGKLQATEREATKRKARRKLHPLPHCTNCGEELTRTSTTYCGKTECQKVKRVARNAIAPRCSEPECDRPAHAKELCGSHYALQWNKLNPDKALAANHRYRSRKRDAWIEDVSRTVVLERDNWTCHLCEGLIPQNIKYPHNQYGTLDHVLPLAKGGTHEYANIKAAHFICNALKQDNEEWTPDELTQQR